MYSEWKVYRRERDGVYDFIPDGAILRDGFTEIQSGLTLARAIMLSDELNAQQREKTNALPDDS